VPAAAAEQALFREAAKRVPKSRYLHNVPCVQLLAVAEEMLEGEIAYRRGEHDTAFARLRAAIALEDDLPYDEPWGWMQPIRHALGALLLEQGHAAEAETVYREDLGLGGTLPRAQIHPDNLWALRGLLDCLQRRGEVAEAALIRQRMDFAAARATLELLRQRNPEFKSADAQLLYARTLDAQDALDEAEREYAALAPGYPGAEARLRYGLLLKRRGKLQEAQRVLKDLLDGAHLSPAHYRRAQAEWLDRARRELG